MCAALVLAVLILPNIKQIALAEVAVPQATKAAIASVAPKEISFGQLTEGIPRTSRFIKFINKSKLPLAAPVASVSGVGFGIAINGCVGTVPIGGNCHVAVFFKPSIVGPVKGMLTFTDADMPNALTVKLTGRGLKGPTATPTSTPTSTASPTASETQTPTATATATATSMSTTTATATASATATVTATATLTAIATATATLTSSATPTPTTTSTPTATQTSTASLTPTSISTQTPTATPTSTGTTASTASQTATATAAVSGATPTATITATPTFSNTPATTASATATNTISPTATATASVTNTPTATATPTSTPTPSAFNVVFVTSMAFDGNLGGLAGADADCQSLANAAGLPGTFVAWLSTSTVNAKTRLGSARGFVRADGQPFADTVSDISTAKILNPIVIDETGANIGFANVWTATASDGTIIPGFACQDWTNSTSSSQGDLGFSSGGPFTWTEAFSGIACSNTFQHLFCFDTSIVNPLTISPASGRIAFVTEGNFDTTSGIAGADADCASQASAAGLTGTFVALLSTSSASAASRFNLAIGSPPYVRPDGIKIADAPAIESGNALSSGIWQHADGSYDSVNVWTGSSTPKVAGTLATTCDDWSNNTSMATAIPGDSSRADAAWWNKGVMFTCTGGASIYCLQQ